MREGASTVSSPTGAPQVCPQVATVDTVTGPVRMHISGRPSVSALDGVQRSLSRLSSDSATTRVRYSHGARWSFISGRSCRDQVGPHSGEKKSSAMPGSPVEVQVHSRLASSSMSPLPPINPCGPQPASFSSATLANGLNHSPPTLSGVPSPPQRYSNGPSSFSSSSLGNQPLPATCGARQLSKLKRFLTTLQQFGSDISAEIGESVRSLVLALVNSTVTIEEFHSRLQEATNFPLRPFVIPFLKISVELLTVAPPVVRQLADSICVEMLAVGGGSGHNDVPGSHPMQCCWIHSEAPPSDQHCRLAKQRQRMEAYGALPCMSKESERSGSARTRVPSRERLGLALCVGCDKSPGSLSQANLPLLQKELLHCARAAKQTPAQYLSQHEQLLLGSKLVPSLDSSEVLLDSSESAKRHSPDRAKEGDFHKRPVGHLEPPAKRVCTISPAPRHSPALALPLPTGTPLHPAPPPLQQHVLEDVAVPHLRRERKERPQPPGKTLLFLREAADRFIHVIARAFISVSV
ncbi:hypothetical protein Z043_118154 [Scleropages formosus]|uniref:TAFH domain-containing protein n=1 Tax=Scleropages formosus TaxID=113540 RepID=A0A0N8JXF3_SCLFO|nr:hypothetical protein Z043_118154 [Scleropages formosus]